MIDLRLYDKITRARNHGTGFRVKQNKILKTYVDVYLPLLNQEKFYFYDHAFKCKKERFSAVLTSPPYFEYIIVCQKDLTY